MLLKITLKDLKPYQREFLEADLAFGQAQIKKEVFDALEKIRNDKNLSTRLVNMINRANPFGIIFENVEDIIKTPLETLKTMDVLKYTLNFSGGETTLRINVDNFFFDLIKQSTFGLGGILGLGKKGFVKKTEKGFRNDYKGHEISVEVDPPGENFGQHNL